MSGGGEWKRREGTFGLALSLGATAVASIFLLALWCPKPRAGVPTLSRTSLGATFRNSRPEHPDDLTWPAEEPGAEVGTTVEGSPAFLAGWRAGDRIATLAGQAVTSACQLEGLIDRQPVGRKVAVELVREGGSSETMEVEPIDGETLFDRLCHEGKADACAELGRRRIRRASQPSASEVEAALALYEKACQGGDASGCSELAGNRLDRHPAGEDWSEEDSQRTAELAEKACDGGYSSGCAHLALLYSAGRGVEQDDARATSLYEIACDGGDPAGCYNVGLNYEKQRGVPRNDGRMLLGYVHGCEGGYPQACTNLGYLYDQGIGVIASPERAAKLYQRACAGDACTAGDPIGCLDFGIFLRDGRGVAKDEERAIELFEKACALEVGAACNNLGILIEPDDAGRARELYRKACRFGSSGGCKNSGERAPASDVPQV
ncbi:MAG TPA: PDZ domain-containing protein [Thermoanaerobaculia bacterium]|nr:PDZ domain-containing protein [Thermoanaerobaculia bacterium]